MSVNEFLGFYQLKDEEIKEVGEYFTSLTSIPFDLEVEKNNILDYLNAGFTKDDLKLMMKHDINNPSQAEFYSKVGMLNLRNIFHPKRLQNWKDFIFHRKALEEKKKPIPSGGLKMLMTCGMMIDKSEYSSHMRECFTSQGGCFNPKKFFRPILGMMK